MYQFKKAHLAVLLGLATPLTSSAAHYCINTAGGFGHGGSTFVAYSFGVPNEGACEPWNGFTKTSASVIFLTTGVGCLSSDGKRMTLSLTSQDPDYLGVERQAVDYLYLARTGSSGSFTSGEDQGYLSGAAAEITCTSALETLPAIHD
jgi:hypothetical protein